MPTTQSLLGSVMLWTSQGSFVQGDAPAFVTTSDETVSLGDPNNPDDAAPALATAEAALRAAVGPTSFPGDAASFETVTTFDGTKVLPGP